MNDAMIRDTKRAKRTPTAVDNEETAYINTLLEFEVPDIKFYAIMITELLSKLLYCIPGVGDGTGELERCLYCFIPPVSTSPNNISNESESNHDNNYYYGLTTTTFKPWAIYLFVN